MSHDHRELFFVVLPALVVGLLGGIAAIRLYDSRCAASSDMERQMDALAQRWHAREERGP